MTIPSRTLTAEFCGDPMPGRSALDGWQPRGEPVFRDLEHRKERDKKRPGRSGKRKYEKPGGDDHSH